MFLCNDNRNKKYERKLNSFFPTDYIVFSILGVRRLFKTHVYCGTEVPLTRPTKNLR